MGPKKKPLPVNQKRKNPSDVEDDYFEADGNDEGEIKVMTTAGKIISLNVKGSDTIRIIKFNIQEIERIPCGQQELIFDELILHNKDKLANLGIKKGFILNLMRNSKMRIFIEPPPTYRWAPYAVEVKPSDTIADLKDKILKRHQSGVEDVYIFNGIVLCDSDTLADFNIIEGSTLKGVVRRQMYMEIYVNTYTGKTITLFVKPTYTIAEVKYEIKRNEGVPVDEQVLIYNKMVLGDTGVLLDLDINRKSTLRLMHKPKGVEETTEIFIGMLNGEIFKQIVNPLDTVDSLKAEIEDKVHIPHHEQELIFNKSCLHNTYTLASYNIHNNATLTVMRIHWGFMRIFIKNFVGKISTLEVRSSGTIRSVKSKIQNMEGIPIEQQRLVFNGKEMENHRSLADYHVSNDSTVNMTIRLRGGMTKMIY